MAKKLWNATHLDSIHEINLLKDCQKVAASTIPTFTATITEIEKMPTSPVTDAYLDNYRRALKELERIQRDLIFWLAENGES